MPSTSPEFEEIRKFIDARRLQGIHGYSDFTIGHYLRKYAKAELRQAEVLRLNITAHFEPSGEECGTIYETLCDHCNFGRQASDLIMMCAAFLNTRTYLKRSRGLSGLSLRDLRESLRKTN